MWVFSIPAPLLPPDVSPTVFGLPPDVTQATLGDIGLQEVTNITTGVRNLHVQYTGRIPLIDSFQIPDNMAIGVDRCLKKCGLTRGEQTTKQQQPRDADNALDLDK